jgi:HEPN domain-containing protein
LARLKDAQVLLASGRFDGAVYVAGYAVETALKARICRRLGWPDYPETAGEFRDYQSLKTHKLHVLLHLSGHESTVIAKAFTDWSTVLNWEPEIRYRPIGTASSKDANDMLDSVARLLKIL